MVTPLPDTANSSASSTAGLHVVHIGKYYEPDTGGIESVTRTLATGAVDAGCRVSVVCFAGHGSRQCVEVRNGVTVYREAPLATVASQPVGLAYLHRCRMLVREADIVHLHAPNLLGMLGVCLGGSHRRLLVHWHSDIMGKGPLGHLVRPLERLVLRSAAIIVATSRPYAEASPTLAAHRRKVVVVPIGIAPPPAESAQVPLPVALSDRIRGRRIVLAVGRLVPYKGLDILIRAAHRLPSDSVVIIVGHGPLAHALQSLTVTERVEDRVILAGVLGKSDLHTLFHKATLLCAPSRSRAEAFGVVLAEAMAYGVPVVATDIPGSGVPWVNQHDISGLNVSVDDPEALAQACAALLTSQALRQRLSAGARRRYLDEFDDHRFLRRMLDVYASLEPGPGASGPR